MPLDGANLQVGSLAFSIRLVALHSVLFGSRSDGPHSVIYRPVSRQSSDIYHAEQEELLTR